MKLFFQAFTQSIINYGLIQASNRCLDNYLTKHVLIDDRQSFGDFNETTDLCIKIRTVICSKSVEHFVR